MDLGFHLKMGAINLLGEELQCIKYTKVTENMVFIKKVL